MRASTGKTPQPTPTYHVAVQVQSKAEQQRMQNFAGTPERLGALRGFCLTRDRHRCVITRAFDEDELMKRLRQPPAGDDDGNAFDPQDDYAHLEVSHIVPFSLTKAEGGGELVCGLFLFLQQYHHSSACLPCLLLAGVEKQHPQATALQGRAE